MLKMEDNCGGFIKCFEKSIFDNAGIDFKINESFMSISAKNVVRGLHFQLHNSQAKVVCAFGGLGCNS